MKKVNIIVLLSLLLAFSISCKKDDSTTPKPGYSITGKAQKGQFVSGGDIMLYELDKKLNKTVKSFSTTITNDDGSFSFKDIKLNRNGIYLTVTGHYFSEVYGEISDKPLFLCAYANVSNNNTNINVLTHLIGGRVKSMVKKGYTFAESNAQAKQECYNFLGINSTPNTNFENLDISINNDENAALLAFSIMLQKYTSDTKLQKDATLELTRLLSQLSSDFADNGVINDWTSIQTLLNNISTLDLSEIRKNIEQRYADLGQTVTIPDFETYINKFQKKYKP